MKLYDYVDARGKNVILEWTRTLGPKEWAKIRNKLERLEEVDDPSILPGLIKGPIQGEKEIFKLQIGGSGSGRALRPMICRGPYKKNEELTLLAGAEERD